MTLRTHFVEPDEVICLPDDARSTSLDMSANKTIVVLREGRRDQDVDVLATEPAEKTVG